MKEEKSRCEWSWKRDLRNKKPVNNINDGSWKIASNKCVLIVCRLLQTNEFFNSTILRWTSVVWNAVFFCPQNTKTLLCLVFFREVFSLPLLMKINISTSNAANAVGQPKFSLWSAWLCKWISLCNRKVNINNMGS